MATQGESPTWRFEQITKKFLLPHTVLANIGQLKTKLKEQERTHFQHCDSCPLFWDNILRQIFPPNFKYCTWRNIFLACWVGKKISSSWGSLSNYTLSGTLMFPKLIGNTHFCWNQVNKWFCFHIAIQWERKFIQKMIFKSGFKILFVTYFSYYLTGYSVIIIRFWETDHLPLP